MNFWMLLILVMLDFWICWVAILSAIAVLEARFPGNAGSLDIDVALPTGFLGRWMMLYAGVLGCWILMFAGFFWIPRG